MSLTHLAQGAIPGAGHVTQDAVKAQGLQWQGGRRSCRVLSKGSKGQVGGDGDGGDSQRAAGRDRGSRVCFVSEAGVEGRG